MVSRTMAAIALAACLAGPALADPAITVTYEDERLEVTLAGDWTSCWYQTWRQAPGETESAPMQSQYALCTGDCFLIDPTVRPGQTYAYTFRVMTPDGEIVEFGPYAVTVPDTPLEARVSPNPSRGPVAVEWALPGSARLDPAIAATARVIDVRGRVVRTLHAGPLARGVQRRTWDGRDDAGHEVGAGTYFLHVATPLGGITRRFVRVR